MAGTQVKDGETATTVHLVCDGRRDCANLEEEEFARTQPCANTPSSVSMCRSSVSMCRPTMQRSCLVRRAPGFLVDGAEQGGSSDIDEVDSDAACLDREVPVWPVCLEADVRAQGAVFSPCL